MVPVRVAKACVFRQRSVRLNLFKLCIRDSSLGFAKPKTLLSNTPSFDHLAEPFMVGLARVDLPLAGTNTIEAFILEPMSSGRMLVHQPKKKL